MTRRAARQLDRRTNISFFRKLCALICLIRWLFPIHVVYLIERPQHRFRIAMAIETPLHQQRVCLENQRHLIHCSVARRASNSLAHVNAVIEVSKVGKAMHFHPLDRLIRTVTFPYGFQIAGIVEQNRVAIHASLGGRDASSRGIFNRSMTIAAIDSVIAHVMFVAELDRLLARNVLPRQIRRSRERQYSRERQSRQKNCGEKAEARDEIRAAVKNLGHDRVALAAGISSTAAAATGRLHP